MEPDTQQSHIRFLLTLHLPPCSPSFFLYICQGRKVSPLSLRDHLLGLSPARFSSYPSSMISLFLFSSLYFGYLTATLCYLSGLRLGYSHVLPVGGVWGGWDQRSSDTCFPTNSGLVLHTIFSKVSPSPTDKGTLFQIMILSSIQCPCPAVHTAPQRLSCMGTWVSGGVRKSQP
jgi:hypothetical protein